MNISPTIPLNTAPVCTVCAVGRLCVAQLTAGTSLEVWSRQFKRENMTADEQAVLAALGRSGKPLTVAMLHEELGCCSSVERCSGVITHMLRSNLIARANTKRPYTYELKGR